MSEEKPAEMANEAAVDTAAKQDNIAAPTTETVTMTKAEIEAMQRALKEANKEAAERRKKLEAFEKAEEDKKQAEMTELEKTKAELDKLTKIMRDKETLELKRQAAAKHGLPEAFIDRLKGDTAEELEADAKALSDVMPKPQKPSPGPTNPGNNATPEKKGDRDIRNEMYGQPGNVFDPNYAVKIGGGIIEHNKEDR